MSTGYRVFIVKGDTIEPLSQKALADLYRYKAILKNFAGQTIDIAIAFYKLEKRKPKEVTGIDCSRIKIRDDGSLDKEHHFEVLRLAQNRRSKDYDAKQPRATGNVVHAADRFEEKSWKDRHPGLSGPAHKKILDALFR